MMTVYPPADCHLNHPRLNWVLLTIAQCRPGRRGHHLLLRDKALLEPVHVLGLDRHAHLQGSVGDEGVRAVVERVLDKRLHDVVGLDDVAIGRAGACGTPGDTIDCGIDDVPYLAWEDVGRDESKAWPVGSGDGIRSGQTWNACVHEAVGVEEIARCVYLDLQAAVTDIGRAPEVLDDHELGGRRLGRLRCALDKNESSAASGDAHPCSWRA